MYRNRSKVQIKTIPITVRSNALLFICITALFVFPNLSDAKAAKEVDGLNGPVNRVVTETGTREPGAIIFIEASTYDANGNRIESEVGSYKIGGPSGERLKTFYVSDPEGHTVFLNSYDANGNLLSKAVHKLDASGNRIEELFYNKDGTLLYKNVHTQNDKERASRTYLQDGSLKSRTVYGVDSNGDVTSVTVFKDCLPSGDCEMVEYRSSNTYDGLGRMTESITYRSDGSLDSRTEYKYDIKGNIIESRLFDSSGSLIEEEHNVYTFDKRGNWIKRTTTKLVQESGKAKTRKTQTAWREIKYY